MSGKLQKRPFTNLSVPFERDRQPVLGDSWRDLTAHFERTSIHWERKVTHLRATYADGEFAAEFHHTGMRAVAGRDEFAGQINHIADFEISQVFSFDRRRQNLLAHSVTPLCVKIS